MNDNLTKKQSDEAQSHAFLVGAVICRSSKVYKYKGVYFKRNEDYSDCKYSIAHKFMKYNCSFMVQGKNTIRECKEYINLLINEFKVDIAILRKVSKKRIDNDYSYRTDDVF